MAVWIGRINGQHRKYERFRCLQLLCHQIIVSVLLLSAAGLHISALRFEFTSVAELQRLIDFSRESPVCIAFVKSPDGVTVLQQNLQRVLNDETFINISSWHFKIYAVPPTQMIASIPLVVPITIPAIHCYTSLTKYHELLQHNSSRKHMKKWLFHVVRMHNEQPQEATAEMLASKLKHYKTVAMCFLNPARRLELENLMGKLQKLFKDDSFLLVHPSSVHKDTLKTKLDNHIYPTVLVLQGKGNDVKILRRFEGPEVSDISLMTYFTASSISLYHLQKDDFKDKVLLESRHHVPTLVSFYSWWAPNVLAHLSAFKRSVEEFSGLGATLKFFLVEVTKDTRDVFGKYISPLKAKNFPFVMLFKGKWQRTTIVGIEHHQLWERPTPWTVFQFLQSNDVLLINESGETIPYPPWKSGIPVLESHVSEGPHGFFCMITSSNLTDNYPAVLVEQNKDKELRKCNKEKDSDLRSPFDVNDEFSSTRDPRLQYIGTLPFVTDQLWSEIIERSNKERPDVFTRKMFPQINTKVTLVVFIMAGCSSCERNMALFEEIKQAVSFIEGSSLYLINCTSDPITCRANEVRGFPTLSAFRGIEWLRFSQCLTAHSAKLKFIKLDYHGVFLLKPIMAWFSSIAQMTVSYVKRDSLDHSVMVNDVQLVGTVMPRDSPYLPYIPRSTMHYYPLECFFLTCEQLYGQAGCYIQENKDVQQSVYSGQGNLVLIQVDLIRKDGAAIKLMQLGQQLLQTIHAGSEHAIHQFHKPHRYNIEQSQKCEGHIGVCTDFLVNFTIDHGRLPVSQISATSFHSNNRMLMFSELPVLIALVHKENGTESSGFFQSLLKVGQKFYNELVVVTADVDEYPAWAGQFVPLGYSTNYAGKAEVAWLYHYPRLCLVNWNDHHHAAFYPSPEVAPGPDEFEVTKIMKFIKESLAHPEAVMVETEHF